MRFRLTLPMLCALTQRYALAQGRRVSTHIGYRMGRTTNRRSAENVPNVRHAQSTQYPTSSLICY